jgi:hypothetical protein
VNGSFVAVNMLVEVAKKYDLGATALLVFDEFGEVVFEVVPRIWIFPSFLVECKFLLMIGSGASLICWFGSYLVGRDNDYGFSRGSVEGNV